MYFIVAQLLAFDCLQW